MSLAELEVKISELSRSDKVQLAQRLNTELGLVERGIEKTPGVVGGDARIAGTRIPIWSLESYRRLGMSEGEMLVNFPSLHAADLVNAWAYVAANKAEIDEAIQENEMA